MAEDSKIEKTWQSFAAEIHSLFGETVKTILVYGSAATSDYVPGKSDVNFLVVLTDEGMEQIERAQKHASKWIRKNWHPLFLTREYIGRSLDSFPVEFLNMQAAYRLIRGEDVLKNLKIEKKDLRLQCERELKGKLLHLRQGFISSGGKAKHLRKLLLESMSAFIAIFRALLSIKDVPCPETRDEAAVKTGEVYGLNTSLFIMLLSLRTEPKRLKKDQLEKKTMELIREIDRLIKIVDDL